MGCVDKFGGVLARQGKVLSRHGGVLTIIVLHLRSTGCNGETWGAFSDVEEY